MERALNSGQATLSIYPMITKTLGTLAIIIICIMVFPVGLAIVGGVFGIVVGVLGAVFGAVFGVIGGIFGAVFGFFGWIFDGLFSWHWPFGLFDCNFFTFVAIVFVIAMMVKSRSPRS